MHKNTSIIIIIILRQKEGQVHKEPVQNVQDIASVGRVRMIISLSPLNVFNCFVIKTLLSSLPPCLCICPFIVKAP